jgi:DNA polymerase-3 subunit alpha
MWSNDLKLQKEFSAIGFYLTGHPLEDYKNLIERQGIISYQKLTEIPDIKCKIAGTISYVMERRSKNGKRFAFVGLTDEDGPFEITIFSNLLSRVREKIIPGTSVILDLEVQREKNNQRLLTNSITPINDFLTKSLSKMKIYLEDPEAIGNIKSRLKRNGSSEVSLCFLSVNDKVHKVELSLGKNFHIDSLILSSIKDISGVSKIEEM